MRNLKQCVQVGLIAVVSLLLVGCFANKAVEKRQYLLHVAQVEDATTKSQKVARKKIALFIAPVSVDIPFSQQNLIYRTSSNRYLVDYYNLFLIPPAQQMDNLLTKYLSAMGKFKIVTQENRGIKLRVKVLELYADYRDRNHPQAVIALRVSAARSQKNGAGVILFDKILQEAIPLRVKSVDNLFVAWDCGLERVLERIAANFAG